MDEQHANPATGPGDHTQAIFRGTGGMPSLDYIESAKAITSRGVAAMPQPPSNVRISAGELAGYVARTVPGQAFDDARARFSQSSLLDPLPRDQRSSDMEDRGEIVVVSFDQPQQEHSGGGHATLGNVSYVSGQLASTDRHGVEAQSVQFGEVPLNRSKSSNGASNHLIGSGVQATHVVHRSDDMLRVTPIGSGKQPKTQEEKAAQAEKIKLRRRDAARRSRLRKNEHMRELEKENKELKGKVQRLTQLLQQLQGEMNNNSWASCSTAAGQHEQ